MKHLKTVYALLVAVTLGTSSFAQDNDAYIRKAVTLEKLAAETYRTAADTAITMFRQAADLYKLAKNNKAAAVCLQNAAYVHDEIKKDNYKSMEVQKEAVALWKKTDDMPGTAEAYKYLAQQHAKMNDNLNARTKSDTAISYYTKLKDDKGISLVYLNLVAMYEAQKQADSAAKFALKAREARSKVKNSEAQLFAIDNTLFRIYTIAGKEKEAKGLTKKLSKNVDAAYVTKSEKQNFYYYSWVYYTKLGKETDAAKYKAWYDEMKKQP
jgi:hypothetical protein